jgi:hypothetical protein
MEKHFGASDTQFVITFVNRWWLDASFGPGTYSDNYRRMDIFNLPEFVESENCETIVRDNLGNDRTLEIGKILDIRVDGIEISAIMPYLKFEDWLRVFDYVREQKRVEPDV